MPLSPQEIDAIPAYKYVDETKYLMETHGLKRYEVEMLKSIHKPKTREEMEEVIKQYKEHICDN